ncbi:flagellar hook capping FlgD N-terminal domain-containing protein [Nocardioides sp. GY 10127]|uniref:flagellar hook capping FlgD N-terminal domain-containing protein n=1 Tax=Nocardioides sp. GY 10127 TaxID=2569762 RepID=UPI0010A92BE4|nr:flagellar hook capping FlgD N-terminal domain-containing protein [Nocardioides sp. GY 10127]TIC78633.1 flagellar hook capping protein [Nocardioides sp. GY 10127]
MSVSATEGIGGSSAWAAFGTDTATTTTSSEDKDMFMNLMVAQLRYQDPMNPADTSDFMAQNAQFSALEAMQQVAQLTSAVLGAQMAFGASGLVGRQVTYVDGDGNSVTGMVSSVNFDATGPTLDVDGTSVPLSSVSNVTAPGSSAGTSTGTSTEASSGSTDSSTDSSTDASSGTDAG